MRTTGIGCWVGSLDGFLEKEKAIDVVFNWEAELISGKRGRRMNGRVLGWGGTNNMELVMVRGVTGCDSGKQTEEDLWWDCKHVLGNCVVVGESQREVGRV